MKYLLSLIVTLTLLTSCGSTPTKPQQTMLPSNIIFSSIDIKMTLTQKNIVETYPDQAKLNEMISEKSLSKFTESKLIGNPSDFSAKIMINYQRRFAGEDTPFPSKSVMAPLISYTIVIFEKDKERQRIERSGLTAHKGFASNLKSTFTMGLGKTEKDEAQDLDTLANTLLTELKALRN